MLERDVLHKMRDMKIRNSEFLPENRQSYTNSYTYSDTKIPSKQEKTATESLLLRFRRGVTGLQT